MITTTREDHVLPRPVDRLPDYANTKARANATAKLVDLYGLSHAAARAYADAAADPADLRKAAEAPERIPVPGGTILGIRTSAWTRRIVPDAHNPRIGPARRHPFAVAPGSDESARFRPLPEPVSDGVRPELLMNVESREHLTWAADQAKGYILGENDWRGSIQSQGVMTEVWVTATTYRHADDTPDVCMPTTAEGSSRITAVHDLLDERSVDLAYDGGDRQMRAAIKRLNESYDRGAANAVAMRCEIAPALFLVGFEPHSGGRGDFASAVKSLVALRHVDPPKPWGEGPEMEALADAALGELEDQGVLTPARRRWMAGALSRAEAEEAHLSGDPAVRAAAIIDVFSSDEPLSREAIRIAVTAQSTRKRITPKLLAQLATALIVRAVAGDDRIDRIRRYMRHGFGKAVLEGAWTATTRETSDLVDQALAELERDAETGGPATLELAARAAYPLITRLMLWGDQGSGRQQPDRRTPGEVIDVMRRHPAGVRQLGRALDDHAADRPIRALAADGSIVQDDDGEGERLINDTYLRNTYPAPGSIAAPASPKTANEKLEAELSEVGGAVRALEKAVVAASAVEGVDGAPLVDAEGVNSRHCDAWRTALREVDERMVIWGLQFRRSGRARGAAETDERDVPAAGDDRDAVIDAWDAAADADADGEGAADSPVNA